MILQGRGGAAPGRAVYCERQQREMAASKRKILHNIPLKDTNNFGWIHAWSRFYVFDSMAVCDGINLWNMVSAVINTPPR
jgi:hypothetical protein